MWELNVITTNSFAAVTTRIWFDDESEARPHYDNLKEIMNKRSSNSGDVLEIQGRGGATVIRTGDVHTITLNDLSVDTFEKLHVVRADREATAAAYVLEKFGEVVANIWAREG